jgi:hypothetical protein
LTKAAFGGLRFTTAAGQCYASDGPGRAYPSKPIVLPMPIRSAFAVVVAVAVGVFPTVAAIIGPKTTG